MKISAASLLKVTQAFEKSKVLVVGDLMLDRFIYGQVDRISPESPVPVLSIHREETMLGGAGNTLANLVSLGAQADIVSLVGCDAEAKAIEKHLKSLKCKYNLVEDKDKPTIVKTRYLAGNQQLLRTDFEKDAPLSDHSAQKLLKAAKKSLKQADILILSDYGKGLLREDIIRELIDVAQEQSVKVIVDPKGRDFSKYENAYAVTPNKKELSDATKGMRVETDKEIQAAALKIIDECDIANVVATRSKDGISVITSDGEVRHFPTVNVEVFDVSGAGDTVIATIASALAAGASLNEASLLANIAGSIVVQKAGTAKIHATELIHALYDGPLLSALGIHNDAGGIGPKLNGCLTPEEALDTIKRWRAQGFEIGFTNGCFDILHEGHVTYLAEARRQCDRLIVGLNRDSSVRILKGIDRPVHDESARAVVLSALSSVNAVVLFGAFKHGDDNTAKALLTLLEPDIYFKGGDYDLADIPEAPTVQSYGGKVRVLSEIEGQSTTCSIQKMKGGKAI